MGLERVERASTAVGSADPLHSDERRIPACWARNVGSAIVGVEADSVIGHRYSGPVGIPPVGHAVPLGGTGSTARQMKYTGTPMITIASPRNASCRVLGESRISSMTAVVNAMYNAGSTG
jgi:hypothetical protein